MVQGGERIGPARYGRKEGKRIGREREGIGRGRKTDLCPEKGRKTPNGFHRKILTLRSVSSERCVRDLETFSVVEVHFFLTAQTPEGSLDSGQQNG